MILPVSGNLHRIEGPYRFTSMASNRTNTARSLAKRWGLDVAHALYRETGNWYHQLERFPGALLDKSGFVIFETKDAYVQCPQLKIRQDVSVPDGISSIPGYTLAVDQSERPTSYEKATFVEGTRRDVIQSIVERDPAARAACIAIHGLSCAACGFNFGATFGRLGEGFIHVHHSNPVSGGVMVVDPEKDLVPLCPNCHAMVHRRDPILSLAEIKLLRLAPHAEK